MPTWTQRITQPFSLVYQGLVRARRAAYRSGEKEVHWLPKPVISVGNLSVGGTGKTPAVAYLADKLSELWHVAILTRGYGRDNSQYLTLNPALLDAKASLLFGDEPVMLAGQLPPRVSIHVGASRYRLGLHALSKGRVDLFLLDDGFQHLELHRDVDIVMLDGQVDLWAEELLPSGTLREKQDALTGVDVLWINRCDENGGHCLDETDLLRLSPDAVLVKSRYEPLDPVNVFTGERESLEEFRTRKVFAFCGIGRPESFERTLAEAGIVPSQCRHFGDHHVFGKQDFLALTEEAERQGAEVLLTTEKDAVRLRKAENLGLPVWMLPVRLRVLEGEDALWARLEKAMRPRG